jgi:hypothetical protein
MAPKPNGHRTAERNGKTNGGIPHVPKTRLPAGLKLDLRQEEIEDPNRHTETILVDPELTRAGKNIRKTDSEHIKALAESINEKGQLQDCIGIYEDDGTVRIWAGRHRRLAVIALNRARKKKGWEPRPLHVKVYKKGLSKEEIFALQVAENLHKEMTPTEEAESIVSLCSFYRHELGNIEAKVTEVARKIGRNPDKVRRALKFSRLNYRVVKMVEAGIFTYTEGLDLSRISEGEAQLSVAEWAITRNVRKGDLTRLVDNKLQSDREAIPLWDKETEAKLLEDGNRFSLRRAFGKAAIEHSGYFEAIIKLMNLFPDRERTFSDGVRDLMGKYILSALRFLEMVKQSDPELYKDLQKTITESFGKPPFWKKKK